MRSPMVLMTSRRCARERISALTRLKVITPTTNCVVLDFSDSDGIEQPHGRTVFGLQADVLGLARRRHGADQALRPFVADPAGAGDVFDVVDIVIDDGEDVDAGQADIGLDLFLEGGVEGGESLAGREIADNRC